MILSKKEIQLVKDMLDDLIDWDQVHDGRYGHSRKEILAMVKVTEKFKDAIYEEDK